jgi:hypothetical protein
MRTSFGSPRDYLHYLQKRYEAPYTDSSVKDEEFHRLTLDALRYLRIDVPGGPIAGIGKAIDQTYKDVVQALSPARRALVETRIAAGVLKDGHASAFIARSPDRKFAILFSSGLALFLHKYIKLVGALASPRAVTYCNRKPAQGIAREEIQDYLDEMIAYFACYSVPRGPLIKLAKREAAQASVILNLAEVFILCHELGHFLNGDLNDEKCYSALPLGIVGQRYEENQNHELEFKADSVGYELYLNTIAAMGMELPAQACLSPVIMMFDLFHKLAGGESSSHPLPHDRIVRIVHNYFSPELAGMAAAALKNPRMLPEVFPIPT